VNRAISQLLRLVSAVGEAALAEHVRERVDEEGRVPHEHGAEEEADEQARPAERQPRADAEQPPAGPASTC
jgi:hypothetical protein